MFAAATGSYVAKWALTRVLEHRGAAVAQVAARWMSSNEDKELEARIRAADSKVVEAESKIKVRARPAMPSCWQGVHRVSARWPWLPAVC